MVMRKLLSQLNQLIVNNAYKKTYTDCQNTRSVNITTANNVSTDVPKQTLKQKDRQTQPLTRHMY